MSERKRQIEAREYTWYVRKVLTQTVLSRYGKHPPPWKFHHTSCMPTSNNLQNFSSIRCLQQVFQTSDVLLWKHSVISSTNLKNSYLHPFLGYFHDLWFVMFVCPMRMRDWHSLLELQRNRYHKWKFTCILSRITRISICGNDCAITRTANASRTCAWDRRTQQTKDHGNSLETGGDTNFSSLCSK